MKTKSKDENDDELRPEYDFESLLKNGVVGKYAGRFREGTNLVLLAPDVARAFPTASDVNEALRRLLKIEEIINISPGLKKEAL